MEVAVNTIIFMKKCHLKFFRIASEEAMSIGINLFLPENLKSINEKNFEEINRLKKLGQLLSSEAVTKINLLINEGFNLDRNIIVSLAYMKEWPILQRYIQLEQLIDNNIRNKIIAMMPDDLREEVNNNL